MTRTARARHPGDIVRTDVVLAHYRHVTEFAAAMKIARPHVSRVLNGQVGISARFARDLERLGHGTARDWMLLQIDYDLKEKR